MTIRSFRGIVQVLLGCVLAIGLAFPPEMPADQAQYFYDELGRLVGVVDGQGNAAVYNYDAVGNLLSIQRFTTGASGVGIFLIAPNSALVGKNVEIKGFGFTSPASSNQVKFNGTTATVVSATASSIVATVPTGATTGPVTVTNANGTTTSPQAFTVLVPPIISGVDPVKVPQGATTRVFIEGFNLSGATSVTFSQSGLSATILSGGTATTLPINLMVGASVPAGSYPFSVTAPTGTAQSGTITTPVQGPDARFSMQAPLLKSLTVQTPLGLTSTLTSTRSVTLSNPNDPLSLTGQTDTLVINGRTYQSVFNQTNKTITTTTPASRTSTVTLDVKGRVVQEQVTGLDAVSYSYDTLGRLSTITQGSGPTARTSTLSYNTKHELTSILDPENRTVSFAYDLASRITTQTLPDLRQIGYSYDGNGNVTSITPPGRPLHAFTYTPVDLESNYTPPDVGFSPRNTQYSYNLDKQLTLVTRPDGQTIQLGYEPTGGRLSTLTLPGAQTVTYAYNATTGNLSTITAPGSTLSYAYDGSLLTQSTWSGTVAGSVNRSYDNNFRITSQSINGANTVAFGYDTDSLLTSAGSETITRSSQHGLITGTTLGVVTDTRGYNPFGEVNSYTANVSSSPVFSTTFTRDKLGRITQKVETIQGVTDTYDYLYDQAGRLREVKKDGTVTATYNYDTNGNRLSKVTSSLGEGSGLAIIHSPLSRPPVR